LLSRHATILHVIIIMLRTQYQRLPVSKHNRETMYLRPLNDLCLDLCWTFTTHQLTFWLWYFPFNLFLSICNASSCYMWFLILGVLYCWLYVMPMWFRVLLQVPSLLMRC